MTVGIILGLLWLAVAVILLCYLMWRWLCDTDEALEVDVSAEWERYVAAERHLALRAEELYRKQIEEGLK